MTPSPRGLKEAQDLARAVSQQRIVVLQQQIRVLRKALVDAHTCANGGLKVLGKPDRVGDLKRHLREIRDIANEALAETTW